LSPKKRKREEDSKGPVRKKQKIHVRGENVPAPIENFADLHERYNVKEQILSNIEMKLGFQNPTPIQTQAMPVMLEGNDILGAAPTGSGKTLAFVVPVIASLKAHKEGPIRCLVLSPTKELSAQIADVFIKVSEGTGIKCGHVDRSYFNLKKAHLDVAIASPLTIVHFLEKKTLTLERLKWLIMDEADHLFEGDFLETIDKVVAACTNPATNKAFFSATLHDSIRVLIGSMIHFPIMVTVGQVGTTASTVNQELVFVQDEAGKLYEIKKRISTGIKVPVLIFVQSKQRARQLWKALQKEGYKANAITSDLPGSIRASITKKFREGEIWFLVCTDVMCRGLDFTGVETVINYDFPQSTTSYIHRCGRTGRAGLNGKAITLWTESDMPFMRNIVNIITSSGGTVAGWMLELKKMTRTRAKKLQKAPPKRKNVTHLKMKKQHAARKHKMKKKSKTKRSEQKKKNLDQKKKSLQQKKKT